MRTNRPLPLALALGTLVAGFGFGRIAPPDPMATTQALSVSFQEVAREVGEAVISVQCYERTRRGLAQRSQGSGVVLRSDGLAITNAHVVRGAEEVRAVLADGRSVDATVIGVDVDTDLAVLRLDGSSFVFAPLAEREPEIGEWVLALGNPLGLGHTVTVGVISGKGRTGLGVATYEDFLQTDAAINPGNSGGPLVNLDGEVVGVNTAMGTAFGGNVGLGFAIPAHMIEDVSQSLVERGRVRRGWLGVDLRDLVEPAARAVGYDGDSRVVITSVFEGTPAHTSGFEPGDLVLRVGADDVSDHNQLRTLIASIEPGTRVRVVVWRNGGERELVVTLGERAAEIVAR